MNLEELALKIRMCKRCRLSEGRINAVPGEGNSSAEILFVGEGPGKTEDALGRPFVGAAGRILDEMLESIGYKREDVFIANVVKCRPPDNRDPEPDEVLACWGYLEAQIKLVQPKLIVTLGRHSMNRFLSGLKISEVHGQSRSASGIWQKKQVYLPLYHPAVSLYSPSKKAVMLEDFKKIPLVLKKIDTNNDS